MSAKLPGQNLVFQLYLNKDRKASEALVKKIEAQGFKAIMLTVDAAVPGKRELDQKAKGEDLKVGQMFDRVNWTLMVAQDGPSTFGKSGSSGMGVAHVSDTMCISSWRMLMGMCPSRRSLGIKTRTFSVSSR